MACDLSCPYPLRRLRSLGQEPTGANRWSLPGRMTELDVPRPILVDVNRIRDDFNIVRVVSDKIGQDRADEGLHTAAEVRTRLVVSASVQTIIPYLETMITGISTDLQYWKNSLKPESSLISAGWLRKKLICEACGRYAYYLSALFCTPRTYVHSR